MNSHSFTLFISEIILSNQMLSNGLPLRLKLNKDRDCLINNAILYS